MQPYLLEAFFPIFLSKPEVGSTTKHASPFVRNKLHEGQEAIDTIKPHFSKFTAADAAKQRDAFAANLRTHLKPGQELTDSALTQIMSMGSLVDTVPLIYNTKDVGFVSVTMYVDDQGASKELPMNRRATAITQQCHQPVQVRGDAFIGRFFDDEDGYARHDFTLAEASDGEIYFEPGPPPSRPDMDKLVGSIRRRVGKVLAAAGSIPPEPHLPTPHQGGAQLGRTHAPGLPHRRTGLPALRRQTPPARHDHGPDPDPPLA